MTWTVLPPRACSWSTTTRRACVAGARGCGLSGFDGGDGNKGRGPRLCAAPPRARPDAIVLDINMPVLDGVSGG